VGKLEGIIALVTGGTSGIGLATAKQFVGEGAHVFITRRREQELSAAAKDIGSNVTTVQGDVSKLDDLDRLFARIRTEKDRRSCGCRRSPRTPRAERRRREPARSSVLRYERRMCRSVLLQRCDPSFRPHEAAISIQGLGRPGADRQRSFCPKACGCNYRLAERTLTEVAASSMSLAVSFG